MVYFNPVGLTTDISALYFFPPKTTRNCPDVVNVVCFSVRLNSRLFLYIFEWRLYNTLSGGRCPRSTAFLAEDSCWLSLASVPRGLTNFRFRCNFIESPQGNCGAPFENIFHFWGTVSNLWSNQVGDTWTSSVRNWIMCERFAIWRSLQGRQLQQSVV